jgi:hypothetical protein
MNRMHESLQLLLLSAHSKYLFVFLKIACSFSLAGGGLLSYSKGKFSLSLTSLASC